MAPTSVPLDLNPRHLGLTRTSWLIRGRGRKKFPFESPASVLSQFRCINIISIYTLSDLGVLSNLIGSLSLANEH